MKSIFLVLVSLFTIQLTFAQSTAYKTFKMESIYLEGTKYVKNDVRYPIGFFGSNLGAEMQSSPHAIAEWKKYKSFRNWGLAASLTGLGLVLGALAADDNTDLQNGLLIGGLTFTIVSLPLSLKANNQIHKSVWTRNRDLLQF